MVGTRCYVGHGHLPLVGQLFLVVSTSMHAVSLASEQGLPAQGKRVPNNDAVHRPQPVRVSPEAEAARARVASLEAAISALGNADGLTLKSLQKFYRIPAAERLEACTQFIERATKRHREIRFGIAEDPSRARLT